MNVFIIHLIRKKYAIYQLFNVSLKRAPIGRLKIVQINIKIDIIFLVEYCIKRLIFYKKNL